MNVPQNEATPKSRRIPDCAGPRFGRVVCGSDLLSNWRRVTPRASALHRHAHCARSRTALSTFRPHRIRTSAVIGALFSSRAGSIRANSVRRHLRRASEKWRADLARRTGPAG